MRRLLLTGFLAAAGMGLFAQSVNKAKDLQKSNKLPEAKTEIDKFLAVEKNNDPQLGHVHRANQSVPGLPGHWNL